MATAEEGDEQKGVVGFAASLEFLDRPISRFCKEIVVVSAEEKSRWRPLPMDKYPKPVVFHDGRLAFRPTAADTLAMFAWLPLGAVLGAARLAVVLTVSYRYSTPILAATGMSWRLKGSRPALLAGGRGQLFVCNHRTLIDPSFLEWRSGFGAQPTCTAFWVFLIINTHTSIHDRATKTGTISATCCCPACTSTLLKNRTSRSLNTRSTTPRTQRSSSGTHATHAHTFARDYRLTYVSVALDRQVRAVSYSLSRLSELISPIGCTVRLTRDQRGDGAVMAKLLGAGHLVVVCPEGTTCREPYMLRFSPLFAELSDDVVPVGVVAVETSMFYATTAGGLKCFDPLYYMVNPRMCYAYTVQFLDRVDTSAVKAGDAPSTDMANLVQRKMGDALGYGCTMLTRKDKYLMLAGNDGIVRRSTDAAATEETKKKST
ncbi:hypothetical protein U9M48_000880 [Paspalum notatum var. saurae]|uniref:Phospholipid/glycerol acyltransferase domain-containing protein n=1 Tax=Paspalum notatum var. saurae TaxID=547442 RepID=A0AAQ3SG98_PASNO